MIRAMVNRETPSGGCESVFAEIALGNNTKKVSSCIPCAIFMQSFGYPASSIHLGKGDNWRIPDNPAVEIVENWRNTVIRYYSSGLEIRNPTIISCDNRNLDDMVAILVVERNDGPQDRQGILSKIPDLFLEALTFEDPFIDRIKATILP